MNEVPPSAPGSERRLPPVVRMLIDIRRGERGAAAWSGLCFFLLLFGYALLKPVRDQLTVGRDDATQAHMFTLTMIAMFAVTPLFTGAMAMFPRRIFVPATYGAWVLGLLGFAVVWRDSPEARADRLDEAFFVFVSVYNLFITAVFWSVMTDLWRAGQGARVFPLIGVGGTLGMIAGSKLVSLLNDAASRRQITLPPAPFFLACAACLVLACVCLWRLALIAGVLGRPGEHGAVRANTEEPGKRGFAAILHVLTRPYLLAVSGYMLLLTFTSTILWNQRNAIIAVHFESREAQRGALAELEFWQQVLTLILQCFVSSLAIRRLGVGLTLAAMPLVTLAGCAVLGLAMRGEAGLAAHAVLWTFAIVTVLRSGLQHAFSRPSREILFTGVSQEDRYAAKTFIDTVVYRAGDAAAIHGIKAANAGFSLLPWGLVLWAVPLSGAWAGLGLWLGRWNRRNANNPRSARPDEPAPPRTTP